MSNNKQSMKLYTEEGILSFLKKEFADEIDAETFMENLTPIELPSELTALNEQLEWLKEQLQQCIDEGYSESWIFAYQRAIKNAESLIEKYKNEQQ